MIDYYQKYIKYKNKYIKFKNKGKDNNIKIIKELGAGMFGTTYLVNYKEKQYAQKIQHILPKDKKQDFNNEMWRELDLYNYISKLPKNEQLFFVKLHGYQIYNNCKHTQKRPFKVHFSDKNNEFAKIIQKLDNSNWCVSFLLDYKGTTTLGKFLCNYTNIAPKLIYSICLQICNIIYILYKGGYSHNDLHANNIMINKTEKKHFNFMNKKIPYEGFQLSAIDYGEVLHNKFGIKYKGESKDFLLDKESWLFRETFYAVMMIIDGFNKQMCDCDKLNKLQPWERKINVFDIATKKMFKNHKDFFFIVRDKYVKQFPIGEKLLDYVINNINNKKTIYDIIKKTNT